MNDMPNSESDLGLGLRPLQGAWTSCTPAEEPASWRWQPLQELPLLGGKPYKNKKRWKPTEWMCSAVCLSVWLSVCLLACSLTKLWL